MIKIIIWIIGALITTGLLVLLTGLFLPTERVVQRKSYYKVLPELLFQVVINNDDWQYRKSLKDLVMVSREKNKEIWDEITKDGAVIRFHTKDKIPFSFYSFEMDASLFTGTWTGEFESDGEGGTVFTATEYIRVRNPFIKTLSYLFFDVGKLMDQYQEDLRQKVNNLK